MSETIRALILSKACIVGIYQRKLEAMARRGLDLLALVPPSWRDERGETRLERAYTDGYRLETLPITFNGSFHLHFYRGLGARIQAFKPHIVHIDEEPYNLATWQALWHARRAGAKTLFFSWQNIHRRYPPPFAWGERWVLRHVDHAIVGTASAGAVWREKGYDGPMTVIPQFGTDTALFRPPEDPRPDRPFTIGYFGRLVEEKGLRWLLEAAMRLPAASWRLRIVGSGPMRDAIMVGRGGSGGPAPAGALRRDAPAIPPDRRLRPAVADPAQLEGAVRARAGGGDGQRRAGGGVGQRRDSGRDRRGGIGVLGGGCRCAGGAPAGAANGCRPARVPGTEGPRTGAGALHARAGGRGDGARVPGDDDMTAWHLIEWVWADHKSTVQAIANGSKHVHVKGKSGGDKVQSTELHKGSFGRSFDRSFNISRLNVKLDDGTVVMFDDVIKVVVDFWNAFFETLQQA